MTNRFEPPSADLAAERGRRSRREQGAQTREMLLDAAAIEFERHGVAGTRIEDISQRAGVTRGALYFHFKTVENIARELLDGQYDLWPELLEGILKQDLRGLRAAREFSVRVIARMSDDLRTRASMHIVEEMGEENTRGLFLQDWQNILIPFLQQAIADHEIREDQDIRDTAAVIVECAWGALLVVRESRRAEDLSDRLEQVWSRLLLGIEVDRGPRLV